MLACVASVSVRFGNKELQGDKWAGKMPKTLFAPLKRLLRRLQLCMLDFPLMLRVKLSVFVRIHPESNKFGTSVENKTTGYS